MEVFLIRHGETNGNLAHRHQEDKTDITEKGKAQALAAANIVQSYAPTHLITSSMLRAVETARIIGEVLNLVPETSTLFAEIEKPKRLNGQLLKSLYSLWFYTRWYFGLTKKEEGGESYKALRDRLLESRQYLIGHGSDARVVVVSHSAFINFFLMHLRSNRPVDPFSAAFCFFKILTIKNGSVIHLAFEGNRWRVKK